MSNNTYSAQIAFLQLLFNGTTWPGIAQNASIGPATELYVGLYNADPGPSGNQANNETAYPNYSRVAIPRSIAGFLVGAGPPVESSNVSAVTFPQCGAGGSDSLTYFGVGLSASGYGSLLYSAPLSAAPPALFTGTQAAPGILTVPGSSLSVNGPVILEAAPFSALPGGITGGQLYYVGTVSGNNVTLSTASGNVSPIVTSSVGSGILFPVTVFAVSNGITPQISTGGLIYIAP